MKKKYKMLFDGTILSAYHTNNSRRTGVFFAAYNIFKGFTEDSRFEISVFCNSYTYRDVQSLLDDKFSDKDIHIVNAKALSTKREQFYNNVHEWYSKSSYNLKWIKILKKIFFIFIIIIEGQERAIKNKEYNKEYDLFLNPLTTAIHKKIIKYRTIPKFNVLYDIMPTKFPEYYPYDQNKISPYQRFILQMKDSENNIYGFSISQNTKEDFKPLVPVEVYNRIKVSYIACDERFKRCTDIDKINSIKQKYGIDSERKYIFSLCTLEPRKNLIRAVKCFVEFIMKNNIDDLVFVLGGTYWERFIDKLEREIDDLENYKKYIVRAGYIDDEDVPILYSGAQWFVYTSQYEGFGMPPLEAMSCGCPVIVSNNSSLPEVTGDGAIAVDWDSDEQHIGAYEKYYYNPEIREKYAQLGLEQSKNFSWEKTVKCMADNIIEVISKKSD